MDKFDRRPDRRARARLIWRFALISGAVLICFVAMFVFGNAAAAWVLGAYVGMLGYFSYIRFGELRSASRLQWSNLPLQSAQGPGFTPREVGALEELFPDACRRMTAFRSAEVVLRWNTGSNCLTAVRRSVDAAQLSMADSNHVAWFRVAGIQHPVGCRFWPATGDQPDFLEFFCGGERTVDIDWARVRFTESSAQPAQAIPKTKPSFDLDRIMIAMAEAQAQHTETARPPDR